MEKFELKINDREYVETVYVDEQFSYDLFENNEKIFQIEVDNDNVLFNDENNVTYSGKVIYQSYDKWMDDTDNLITLHDLDAEEISEKEKEFIYFIEASVQLFYEIGADATWPSKWWDNLELDKFVYYNEVEDTNEDSNSSNSIDKLKKLFHLN